MVKLRTETGVYVIDRDFDIVKDTVYGGVNGKATFISFPAIRYVDSERKELKVVVRIKDIIEIIEE